MNEYLRKNLAQEDYYEAPHTEILWKHISCTVTFSLVVNDFGIKYVGKDHSDHLIWTLKK